MSRKRLLKDVAEVERFASILSRCKSVTQFDTDQEKEAWTLAHCLSDLEGSFRMILEQHLPSLLSEPNTEGEIADVLHDIGEELRHIIYHVRDPRFYRYLLDER